MELAPLEPGCHLLPSANLRLDDTAWDGIISGVRPQAAIGPDQGCWYQHGGRPPTKQERAGRQSRGHTVTRAEAVSVR